MKRRLDHTKCSTERKGDKKYERESDWRPEREGKT